jgi:hypothetical protein
MAPALGRVLLVLLLLGIGDDSKTIRHSIVGECNYVSQSLSSLSTFAAQTTVPYPCSILLVSGIRFRITTSGN